MVRIGLHGVDLGSLLLWVEVLLLLSLRELRHLVWWHRLRMRTRRWSSLLLLRLLLRK